MELIQNVCPVKEVRDGVSRSVNLSSFPETSTVCKYWLITTLSILVRGSDTTQDKQRFMFSQKYVMQCSPLDRVSMSFSLEI